jgi:hypothetical protein
MSLMPEFCKLGGFPPGRFLYFSQDTPCAKFPGSRLYPGISPGPPLKDFSTDLESAPSHKAKIVLQNLTSPI